MRKSFLAGFCVLSGCASGMAPLDEPVFTQSFTVSNPSKSVNCSGIYNRAEGQTEALAPLNCADGRTGRIAIVTDENGHPTLATASLSDGSTAHARFRPILQDRHAYAEASNLVPAAGRASVIPRRIAQPTSRLPMSSRSLIRGPRGGCYYLTAGGSRVYVDRSKCG